MPRVLRPARAPEAALEDVHSCIKTQKSEERLCQRLESLKAPEDDRPLVLAYGSWGLVAGKPGTACNKGNPPCIGVGLMRKLARRFVVAPTPEAFTSKTCCVCFGKHGRVSECGPWAEKEEEEGRKIRRRGNPAGQRRGNGGVASSPPAASPGSAQRSVRLALCIHV